MKETRRHKDAKGKKRGMNGPKMYEVNSLNQERNEKSDKEWQCECGCASRVELKAKEELSPRRIKAVGLKRMRQKE